MEKDDKLSLQVCTSILNKNGLEYSDDEIIQLRDFLYLLVETTIHHFQRKAEQDENMNPLIITNHEDYVKTESIPLYQGEHRRTG